MVYINSVISMKDEPAIVVLTRKYYPASNITLGLVLYLIGLLISIIYNLQYYFQFWYIYIGIFGIIWVSTLWVWGFNYLKEVILEIKLIFEKEEIKKIDKDIQEFISSVSNDLNLFLFSIPGFIIVTYTLWRIHNRSINLPLNISKIFFDNVILETYIIIIVLFCAYFIFASVFILFNGILYFKKISKYSVKIKLLQLRNLKFEKINNALLVSTAGWFVGVSLIMTLLFIYSNIIIIIFLAFVVIFGLSFFFIPQILLHKSISKSKENLLLKIGSEFSSKIKFPTSPNNNIMEGLLLCLIFDQVSQISEWPINTNTVFKLLSSIIIPVTTALIGIIT